MKINDHLVTGAKSENAFEDIEDSDADAQHLLAWLDLEASFLNADQRVRLLAQLRAMQANSNFNPANWAVLVPWRIAYNHGFQEWSMPDSFFCSSALCFDFVRCPKRSLAGCP